MQQYIKTDEKTAICTYREEKATTYTSMNKSWTDEELTALERSEGMKAY